MNVNRCANGTPSGVANRSNITIRRIVIVTMSAALVAAACGNGDLDDPPSATVSTVATTSNSTTTQPMTTAPPSPAVTTNAAAPTTTTTTPDRWSPTSVEALAWGLLCRDLAAAGWDYAAAVEYWELEGRPARMDADENGIPCETTYPSSDVAALWGDPLPTGLVPGPGSGWRLSHREAPVTAACCSMNNNGPVSPPLPAELGPWPDDGVYAVTVTRQEGQTADIELEIRRWLSCSERPDQCGPDLLPGDVYSDPDSAVTRSVELDEELLVVLRPVPCSADGTWTEVPIEGSGAALATLLRRLDAAAALVGPYYGSIDLAARGAADPTFPYGPVPCEDLGWVLGYRGPDSTYLTDGLYTVVDWEEPTWMYGWWPSLEIIAGTPVLYLWAGQIAG